MRIISGRFRGLRLVPFKADHIRPTTDRVKETIFNILMHEVPEARVLDLFAGTGSLGLEALSRGAGHVVFVDNHRQSLQILSKNIKALKVEKEVEVKAQDVFQFVQSYKADPFQLIFVDPPFTEEIAHDVMVALADAKLLAPGGIIIIESRKQERMDDAYPGLKLIDRRDFGDKKASFFS